MTQNQEIVIRPIDNGWFDESSLDGFDRRQQVTRQYLRQDSGYVLADNRWLMDWPAEHKRTIAKNLLNRQECTAFAAVADGRVAGFVSVLNQLHGRRMILDIIQVDAAYRGRGLGRRLWHTAMETAQAAGAEELYISACSSEETVAFYRAMGAVITDDPIASIAEEEPCDVQMAYRIL